MSAAMTSAGQTSTPASRAGALSAAGEGVSLPAGWPRASRPVRVALLGWARLAYQGTQGSGYNLSASELAAGLAMSGHAVFYLSSGRTYDLRPWAHIRREETWRGVDCFDLVNSRNLSPASYNFANMGAEASSPRDATLVLRWLDRHRIEIVHIHSLEGFPLDLIARVRASGRPVVVTPHNYWYACPQVDLMQDESRLCMDYDGGRACETCIRKRPPGRQRLKRRLGQAIERVLGVELGGLARTAAPLVRDRLRQLRGQRAVAIPNERAADPESAAGFDVESGLSPRAEAEGVIIHNLGAEPGDRPRKPVAATPIDANEVFLASDRHLVVLNDYGRRRAQGVEALNQASAVTPPSDFVRRAYVAMGLEEARSRVVRLGQPHFDQINRRTRRSPFYDARPWEPGAERPVRFGFFGAMRPSKGIDVVCEAIPLLPAAIRRRCQFHIRAMGHDWTLRKRLSLFPEVSFLGGYDLVQLIGAGAEYDVGLLPHVWFENSPLVLLEHLHAGKFVISSRLGGPLEWVRPPKNGLLVAGGRADELAGAIASIVEGAVRLPSPREVHEATPNLQSYPEHVAEVEGMYAGLLGAAARGAEMAGAKRAEPSVLGLG
ncbi:MAG: glycosyltransferase [Phycisphaerales bacterium]